ncbi:MAG: hypothetical protein WBI53_03320 [Paludibacter sp.]
MDDSTVQRFNNWLIGSLPHWHIGTLPHYLIGALAHYLIGTLPHYLITSLAHWHISALAHYLITSLAHCLIGTFPHSQILKSSYVLSDIQLLKSTSTKPDVSHTATRSTCGCAPTMAAWENHFCQDLLLLL